MEECWGNPSSLHFMGREARSLLKDAKKQVASLLKCREDNFFFTPSGTCANNTAIFGAYEKLKKQGNRIVTTAFEHPSVSEPLKLLEKKGVEIVRIAPDKNGIINEDELLSAINADTILVSCMAVNNEVGTVTPLKNIPSAIKRAGAPALFHSDCVQAFGKIDVSSRAFCADIITVSAHKIHGLKGSGGIFLRDKNIIKPYILGGGQEKGMRPGTEAVPNIAAFAKACEIRMAHFDEDYAHVQELADYLKQQVSAELPDAVINGEGDIPHVVNLSMPGCKSEVMLHVLEGDEVYISSGSACSKGKQSGVLKALGLPKARTDSALRVSFAPFNTKEDVDAFINAVKKGAKMFRR